MTEGREAEVVRIHYFASETRRAVQTALIHGEIDGVDGYIIDLRNDPGAPQPSTLHQTHRILNALLYLGAFYDDTSCLQCNFIQT